MKLHCKALYFLALIPSIVSSRYLKRGTSSKGEFDIESFVGTAMLQDITEADGSKSAILDVATLSGTSIEIKRVTNYESLSDVKGLLKFRGKEQKGPFRWYQAACASTQKDGSAPNCMIYREVELELDTTPNDPVVSSVVDRFCSPTSDLGNCDYMNINPCLYTSDSPSNDTCADANLTCVANDGRCKPPNYFACGLPDVTGDVAQCSHDINCTGSDGLANHTICGTVMRCFDLCGPTA